MASISVRIEPKGINEISGQTRHDLRLKTPSYVDKSRTAENSVLIRPVDGKELLNKCENIRKNQPKPPRALKKNCRVGISGIITFSSEAKTIIENLGRDKQNELFLQAGNKIAEFLNTDLTGLVIHRDEASIHCHFQCPAYNFKGFSLSNAIKPADLSKLQDITAEVFKEYGIERGKPKKQRIQDGEDYSKIIHRSVKQLHDDLPKEIAELQAKLAKNQDLLRKTEEKIATGNGDLEKLKEREKDYQNRIAKIEADIEKFEKLLNSQNPPSMPKPEFVKVRTGYFKSQEKEIVEAKDLKRYTDRLIVFAGNKLNETNKKKEAELQEKEKELLKKEKEIDEKFKDVSFFMQDYKEKNELLQNTAKKILFEAGIDTRNIYLQPTRATEIIKNYLVGGLEKVKEFWQKLQHSFSLSR